MNREGERDREREREREGQSPVNPKPFKHETHLKTQEAPCDDFNGIFLHSGSMGVSDKHFLKQRSLDQLTRLPWASVLSTSSAPVTASTASGKVRP